MIPRRCGKNEISTAYVDADSAENDMATYFITVSLLEVPHPVCGEEFVMTSTANSPTSFNFYEILMGPAKKFVSCSSSLVSL